jgi:RNA polymerase sigma factor (sigma-70 family)
MAKRPANSVLQYIRRIAATDAADATADRQLLERFTRHQDEGAFETLVQRHGPLVWGVCRRILSDRHDAEDAFQVTLLVFVRKARTIGRGELLGHWLYGVAYRVAVRARANAARRRVHEYRAEVHTPTDPCDEAVRRDLGPVLDEEVRRLPVKYRVPVILCYLQGKTNEEAAREMGCPKGTVLSRLARARERLRVRLTRRGLALSVGALAAGLSATGALAAVPLPLLQRTVRAGMTVALGKATGSGVVSPSVEALAKGVLQTMFVTKWMAMIGVFLVAGILGTGAGMVGYHVSAAQATDPDKPPPDPEAVPQGIERTDLVRVASPMDGVLLFIGTEMKEGELVSPGLVISIPIGTEVRKFRRLKKGDRVAEGQLLARLDDRLARDEYAITQKKIEVAEAEYKATVAVRDEYKVRWETFRKRPGADPDDVRLSQVQMIKADFEAQGKEKVLEGAKLELKKAQTLLEMHEIRCRTSGVIQAIAKYPGEAVKKLETVFVIRAADK